MPGWGRWGTKKAEGAELQIVPEVYHILHRDSVGLVSFGLGAGAGGSCGKTL